MTWRDRYQVHPAADVFPMMSDEELDALAEDIKARGLNLAIVVRVVPHPEADDDVVLQVLDGRNRLEACERAGVDLAEAPVFRVYDGDDPYSYVVSANVLRRHLTAGQKRDVIAKLLNLAPERSDRQIAKDVGVDHKTVGAARKKAEMSGEIPHSPKRIGADGRTTKAKTKPRTPPEKRGEIPPFDPSSKVENEAQSVEAAQTLLKHNTMELRALIDSHRAEFLSLEPQPGTDPRGSEGSPLLDWTEEYDLAASRWGAEQAWLCARLTRPEDPQVVEHFASARGPGDHDSGGPSDPR